MTEVLHSASSSSSPSISTPTRNAAFFHQTQSYVGDEGVEEEEIRVKVEKRESERRDQLSLLALLVTLFRKRFWLTCKTDRDDFHSGRSCGGGVMEIGWPTEVQHVNHVIFDRFDGFLGLPVEFEPEVPRRAPSASATVFGVSTESMQMSYDVRGNSVPTILLLLQRHLYSQGGLQVEGIFRITAGNSQDEYVREQLNRGVIPDGIDVHCLAGLIKAWFRELPRGVLDSLSPEQVMQCQSEEDFDVQVRLLPPTEAALLDWAINLMADVVQEEHLNKMNTRNIAMVFAPNMTQMNDPLTALMYAVQVMNFVKTLIEKTLEERKASVLEPPPIPPTDPFDDNGNQSVPVLLHQETSTELTGNMVQAFVAEDPGTDSGSEAIQSQIDHTSDEDYLCYSTSTEESDESVSCGTPIEVYRISGPEEAKPLDNHQSKQTKSGSGIVGELPLCSTMKTDDGCKGLSNLCRINSTTGRCVVWW